MGAASKGSSMTAVHHSGHMPVSLSTTGVTYNPRSQWDVIKVEELQVAPRLTNFDSHGSWTQTSDTEPTNKPEAKNTPLRDLSGQEGETTYLLRDHGHATPGSH